jgi:hypothetical protein
MNIKKLVKQLERCQNEQRTESLNKETVLIYPEALWVPLNIKSI